MSGIYPKLQPPLQPFANIANYIESTEQPKLDLMDITAIISPQLRDLR